MAEIEQMYYDLPITIVKGDDLSFKVDFQKDTSAYTFTAQIIPAGSPVTPIVMTVGVINSVLGTYTVSVSKTLLTGLPSDVSHKWKFIRTTALPAAITRTLISGDFKQMSV